MLPADVAQEGHAALPVAPHGEVGARHEHDHAQGILEQGCKRTGAELGESGVEGRLHDHVYTRLPKQPHTFIRHGEITGLEAGFQHRRRVIAEGQDDGRKSPKAGAFLQSGYEAPVAQVDAVEDADGNG